MTALQRVGTTVAIVGGTAYALVVAAIPFIDRTFDVLSTHPEDYATGNYGLSVNLAYVALGLALIGLALALLPVRRAAIAVPILLVLAAIMCLGLGVDPIGLTRGNSLWVLPVVGLAIAPLVASLSLHDRISGWRRPLIALAAVVLIAFIALLAAPDTIGGIVNRAFDLVAALWVIAIAVAVRGDAAKRLPRTRGQVTERPAVD